jgi:hypothetical protein
VTIRIPLAHFCPQLYRLDSAGKAAALGGEAIGKLLAQSVRDDVVEKQPWLRAFRNSAGPPNYCGRRQDQF